MGFRIVNGKPYSTVDFPIAQEKNEVKQSNETKSFKEILNEKSKKDSFVISNHAALRLQHRNINLNQADMKNINEGINKAEEKGSKECLILYKDVALVTSIKNRTVITAVDRESGKGNVFTNIDSVLML